MDNLDIFYNNKWIDIEDQVSIRKKLLSESVSIYYITLHHDTLKLRFDNNADECTKAFIHAQHITTKYSKELYNYIVSEIADLRDCSIEEVTDIFFYVDEVIDYDEEE